MIGKRLAANAMIWIGNDVYIGNFLVIIGKLVM